MDAMNVAMLQYAIEAEAVQAEIVNTMSAAAFDPTLFS